MVWIAVTHLNLDTLVDSASKVHKDFKLPGLIKDSLLLPEDMMEQASSLLWRKSVFF